MPEQDLFSVRMHSQRNQCHHSGAERLCRPSQVADVSRQLVQRAMQHSRGQADSLTLQVDQVEVQQLQSARLLEVHTCLTVSVEDARAQAVQRLQQAGVPVTLALQAIDRIAQGANGQGGSMRGAMLVDIGSGNRCEPDPHRGVRVSRMDMMPEQRARYQHQLADQGLDQSQTHEALILASKVAAAPGVVAELCWSDDPDYTTGYVASADIGYVRLPSLKGEGDHRGGRALFIRTPTNGVSPLIHYLEQTPVIVDLELSLRRGNHEAD